MLAVVWAFNGMLIYFLFFSDSGRFDLNGNILLYKGHSVMSRTVIFYVFVSGAVGGFDGPSSSGER